MDITLSDLIGETLNQIEKSRKNSNKKNYLVDEVIFELSVSSVTSGNGGIEFKIFNIGTDLKGKIENKNLHKITLKLKPKTSQNIS